MHLLVYCTYGTKIHGIRVKKRIVYVSNLQSPPTYALFTVRKVGRQVEFLGSRNGARLEMVSYVCVYSLVQFKSALIHTGTHLCYRQAVFFRHLRLTALSSPQGNIRGTFLQCYNLKLFCFLSCVSLKLGNWKWPSGELSGHAKNVQCSLCMP
jgi:hypothetical protein